MFEAKHFVVCTYWDSDPRTFIGTATENQMSIIRDGPLLKDLGTLFILEGGFALTRCDKWKMKS